MHGRCVEGARKVRRRCAEGAWKVMGTKKSGFYVNYNSTTRTRLLSCAETFQRGGGDKKSGFYVN